jgi:hypothetical protein
MSEHYMEGDYSVKPRPVSKTEVKTVPEVIAPVAIVYDLKTRLLAVLQQDPGTAEVTKNPWLHDVFVRKVKALVE